VTRGLQLDPAAKLLIRDIGGGSTELIRAEPGRELDVAACKSVRSASPSASCITIRRRPRTRRWTGGLAVNEAPRHWNGIFARPDGRNRRHRHNRLQRSSSASRPTIRKSSTGIAFHKADVIATIAKLGALPLEERKKLPGLEPGRADVIFAGAAILERIMCHFNMNELVVSDQGVRWGLLWRTLETLPSPAP